jgi:CspA family cold shock protein
MAKGRSRSLNRTLRQRFPLLRERQSQPRFDEPYRCGIPPYTVEFRHDGSVLVGGEPGAWSIDARKALQIATPRWRCEGAIGVDDLYLLCALENSPTADIQLELRLGPEIRRPDLLGVRRTGTVTWYSDDKGNGRITADDGEWLWFHHTGVIGVGYRSFHEGDRVSFVWDGAVVEEGRHAVGEVSPLDES